MPVYPNTPFLKSMGKVLLTLTAALFLTASPVLAENEKPYPADTGELSRMSIFLNNFTEQGFMNFDVRKKERDGGVLGTEDFIRFGIWHNYLNNFKSRISMCTVENCQYGSLIIEGKYVVESVKKYFDLNLKNQSIPDPHFPIHFDGKKYHFEGADGERFPLAQVENVFQKTDGTLRMTGYLYDAEDPSDRPATFEAIAKQYLFKDKKTWAILSMHTNEQERIE